MKKQSQSLDPSVRPFLWALYQACWDAIVDAAGKPTGQGIIAYDPSSGSIGGFKQLPNGWKKLFDVDADEFGPLPDNKEEFVKMCLTANIKEKDHELQRENKGTTRPRRGRP